MRQFYCNVCGTQCDVENGGDCVVVIGEKGQGEGVKNKRVCNKCADKLVSKGWREVSNSRKVIAA